MLNRPGIGAAFDRVQGSAATALGLLVVVLAFVYLVPRQGDIATAMNARRAEALAASAATEQAAKTEADSMPGTEAPPAEDPSAPATPDASPPAPPPQNEAAVETEPPAPSSPGQRSQLLARPVVLDTATILIRQGRVRLAGIRAAPLAKKCGEEGPRGWFCGVEARTRFRSWLRARSISCGVPPNFGEKAEEVESRCDLAGEDIGGWLVANGFAEAVPGGAYVAAEGRAKAGKLGIWADKRAAD